MKKARGLNGRIIALLLVALVSASTVLSVFASSVQAIAVEKKIIEIGVSIDNWIAGQTAKAPVVTVGNKILNAMRAQVQELENEIEDVWLLETTLSGMNELLQRFMELITQYSNAINEEKDGIIEEMEAIELELLRMYDEAVSMDSRVESNISSVSDFFPNINISLLPAAYETFMELILDYKDEINDFRIIIGEEQEARWLETVVLNREISVIENIQTSYILVDYSQEVEEMHARLDQIHALLRDSLITSYKSLYYCYDRISYIQTADGSLQSINDMANRMIELLTSLMNGTHGPGEEPAIHREIESLKAEMHRIYLATDFNREKIFVGTGKPLLQLLGLLDVIYETSPLTYIGQLAAVADFSKNIDDYRGEFGAEQNVLEFNIGPIYETINTLEEALSNSIFYYLHFPKNEEIEIDLDISLDALFQMHITYNYQNMMQRLLELFTALDIGYSGNANNVWQEISAIKAYFEDTGGAEYVDWINNTLPLSELIAFAENSKSEIRTYLENLDENKIYEVPNEMKRIEERLSAYYEPFNGKTPIQIMYIKNDFSGELSAKELMSMIKSGAIKPGDIMSTPPTEPGKYIIIAKALNYAVSPDIAGINYFEVYPTSGVPPTGDGHEEDITQRVFMITLLPLLLGLLISAVLVRKIRINTSDR